VIDNHLYGRSRILADGKPIQDHERRQVLISASLVEWSARLFRSASPIPRNGANLPVTALVTSDSCRVGRWVVKAGYVELLATLHE